MQYCKEKLGAESVEVLVLGLGGVVKKENEKIDEEPGKYPNRNFTIINVDRESTTSSPGAGSSTDPLPVSAASVMPDVSLLSINIDLLYKYREKCKGTQYIIKSVSNQGIEYYEFKEVEDEDNVISPNITSGDVGWVKKIVPVSEFDEFCTEQDLKDLEDLKEDNMEIFLGAPAEIKQVSKEYKLSNLETPLPEDMPQVVPEEDIGELTNEMLKAIRIQQKSGDYIKKNFPNLYDKKLTMFPVFVYGMENQNILFLKANIEDNKLILVKGFVTVKVLNTVFKRILSDINSKIELGMYYPSENIQEELNEASKEFPEILPKIRKFYDKDYLEKFVNVSFGTLEDEYPDWLQDDQTRMNVVSPQKKVSRPFGKVSKMTISEIEERMKTFDNDGKFWRTYYPDKYTNILGVDSVRYLPRKNVLPKDDLDVPYNSGPIIKDFKMDDDNYSDPDLLFD
tara:strand:- start:657 stop:2015 length:1359 start_codon:yes stop_codon:yes gene_type:complete